MHRTRRLWEANMSETTDVAAPVEPAQVTSVPVEPGRVKPAIAEQPEPGFRLLQGLLVS